MNAKILLITALIAMLLSSGCLMPKLPEPKQPEQPTQPEPTEPTTPEQPTQPEPTTTPEQPTQPEPTEPTTPEPTEPTTLPEQPTQPEPTTTPEPTEPTTPEQQKQTFEGENFSLTVEFVEDRVVFSIENTSDQLFDGTMLYISSTVRDVLIKEYDVKPPAQGKLVNSVNGYIAELDVSDLAPSSKIEGSFSYDVPDSFGKIRVYLVAKRATVFDQEISVKKPAPKKPEITLNNPLGKTYAGKIQELQVMTEKRGACKFALDKESADKEFKYTNSTIHRHYPFTLEKPEHKLIVECDFGDGLTNRAEFTLLTQ